MILRKILHYLQYADEPKKRTSLGRVSDISNGMKESATLLANVISGKMASKKSKEEKMVDLRNKEADLMSKYVEMLKNLEGSEGSEKLRK